MTVDFSRQITNLSGHPIQIEGQPVTLKYMAVTALLGPCADQVSGQERARRYEIAKRIHADQTVCAPDEIALIKALIGAIFVPLLVGPAYEILDAALADEQPQSTVIDMPAAAQAEQAVTA